MVVRISLMVLRLCVLLAVILGVLFWLNVISPAGTIRDVHQTLGILVVVTLWIIGVMLLTRGGSTIGLAVAALVWGALVVYVGLNQETLLPGSSHWIIQVVHLLLGLGAAGLGESCAARYKRARKAVKA
jgi:ABC-type polysaccharide/polyol phosphate export permease